MGPAEHTNAIIIIIFVSLGVTPTRVLNVTGRRIFSARWVREANMSEGCLRM
jgi:hypothetical protein